MVSNSEWLPCTPIKWHVPWMDDKLSKKLFNTMRSTHNTFAIDVLGTPVLKCTIDQDMACDMAYVAQDMACDMAYVAQDMACDSSGYGL